MWFAAQLVFFMSMLAAPLLQRSNVPLFVRLLGLLLAAGGLAISIAGYRALGQSHSPGTTPISGAALVASGIYGHVRHPIYAGWSLGSFGFAFLTGSVVGVGVAVALVVFYDLRTREEEKFLLRHYPDYDAYKQRVRRFMPGLY